MTLKPSPASLDPGVVRRVQNTLHDLEFRRGVRVLFACESGSRAWGFASQDSDYDVRFLYVHERDWYLSVDEKRDVIELPLSDELDVSGWELRKALRLLRKSNPSLLEWLRSPMVYWSDPAFLDQFRALSDEFYSPKKCFVHYLHMAFGNYRDYLRGRDLVSLKKYLYVLRPLLAARWIRARPGVPPMRFAELAQHTLDPVADAALIAEINALLEVKMRAGESATSPRWPGIHAFIESELAANAAEPVTPLPSADGSGLDAFLCETVLRFDAAAGATATVAGEGGRA